MRITSKGIKWELLNSLWILWSFTLFFYYVAFFWIGARAKQKKWTLLGCLYLLNFSFMFLMVELKPSDLLLNISMIMFLIGWIASIIQSFMFRKEYLIRREAILNLEEAKSNAYREKIQNSYSQPLQTFQQPQPNQAYTQQPTMTVPPIQPVENPPEINKTIQHKIELNSCTEQQLSNLPGVGVALAKKAIIMRTQAEGFASVDDFIMKLQIMPHFAVQIENLAYVAPIKPNQNHLQNAGRVIDI